MRVKMLVKISGTRNGKDWPDPGKTLDVSAEEGEQLIAQRVAVAAGKDADVETATAPTDDTETRDGDADSSDGSADGADETSATPAPAKRTASKRTAKKTAAPAK